MRTRMLLGMLLCGAFGASGALGQTWNGDSVNSNNWTDGANWASNNAPANNGTATPNFAGGTRPTPSVNISYDVNGVTFDNQASAFNIISVGSSVLTLRGAGVTNNNGSVTQTISVATNLGAAQTWGGAGGLNIGGPVVLNANVLTVDTPAIVALIGIVSGTGSVVKNGSGAVALSGNSVFTGGVTIPL
jgi:fibronectin-binding autotransporter adhesin